MHGRHLGPRRPGQRPRERPGSVHLAPGRVRLIGSRHRIADLPGCTDRSRRDHGQRCATGGWRDSVIARAQR